MMNIEFGKNNGENLTDTEAKDFSGFDRFFSPEEFKEYLTYNNGQCNYLLYVKATDPISKLRKPGLKITHELLNDDNIRQIIKENSLIPHIDNPECTDNSCKLYKTKSYLQLIGMGVIINSIDDISSPDLRKFIEAQGVNIKKAKLRLKPVNNTKGSYGQINNFSYPSGDSDQRRELKKGIKDRGPYVVQLEMDTLIITNTTNKQIYTCNDRIFVEVGDGRIKFFGGLRNLMPIDDPEARNGRIHGGASAIWAEILPTTR